MYFKAPTYITSVTSNIMHFRFGQLFCFTVILHYWVSYWQSRIAEGLDSM